MIIFSESLFVYLSNLFKINSIAIRQSKFFIITFNCLLSLSLQLLLGYNISKAGMEINNKRYKGS